MTFGSLASASFNPREANTPAFQEYSFKAESSSPPGDLMLVNGRAKVPMQLVRWRLSMENLKDPILSSNMSPLFIGRAMIQLRIRSMPNASWQKPNTSFQIQLLHWLSLPAQNHKQVVVASQGRKQWFLCRRHETWHIRFGCKQNEQNTSRMVDCAGLKGICKLKMLRKNRSYELIIKFRTLLHNLAVYLMWYICKWKVNWIVFSLDYTIS